MIGLLKSILSSFDSEDPFGFSCTFAPSTVPILYLFKMSYAEALWTCESSSLNICKSSVKRISNVPFRKLKKPPVLYLSLDMEEQWMIRRDVLS
jgi:hypothetical protein